MTLDELEIKCKNCTKCDLCEGRTNLVFGIGKKDADIMLIGEGPGENEDLQGQPFVGRSGQLLDKFLASVDLSRDKNVYIANMVKCRPPKNRDPKPEEQDMCINWLREQFKIIKNGHNIEVKSPLHEQVKVYGTDGCLVAHGTTNETIVLPTHGTFLVSAGTYKEKVLF